ncbi:MAG: NUDIX hydrolase [Anaerolineae bacterium]|nr:NUDIX hydrolase [Anaerolineae bacterium]MDW8071345.1 NUDIX hydrolase [Anaerolineae bacterium]
MTTSQRSEYPESPQVGVGAVLVKDGCVLLVKRASPPSQGTWAIPGGRVKLGETLQHAAERELREETGIIARAGSPIYTFDVIQRDETGQVRFHYVIVDLWMEYVAGEVQAGDDAAEARWITYQDLDTLPIHPTTRTLLERIMTSSPTEAFDTILIQQPHHPERVVELIHAARAWLREEPGSAERLKAAVHALE